MSHDFKSLSKRENIPSFFMLRLYLPDKEYNVFQIIVLFYVNIVWMRLKNKPVWNVEWLYNQEVSM